MWCAAVGVAAQLGNTAFHRVGNAGLFGFNNDKRQVVHETQNIGDNIFVNAFNFILVYTQKIVVGDIVKINNFYDLTFMTFT